MPTADASLLLPPPFPTALDDDERRDRDSARSLDQVGVEAVLEAMIVQRRAQSSHHIRHASAPRGQSEIEPTELEPEALREEEEDEITSPDTFGARERRDRDERARTSEVFLKVR